MQPQILIISIVIFEILALLKCIKHRLKSTDTILRFKFSSEMTPNVAMNFKSERENVAELESCPGCCEDDDSSVRDTQKHVLEYQATLKS